MSAAVSSSSYNSAIPSSPSIGSAASILSAMTWLDEQAKSVRSYSVPWDGLHKINQLSATELELISKYDRRNPQIQAELIATNGKDYARMFLNLLSKQLVKETAYVVLLVDEMLAANSANVKYFHEVSASNEGALPYTPFLDLLDREPFIKYTSCRILAALATFGEPLDASHVSRFVSWLSKELHSAEENSMPVVLSALQGVLAVEQFRLAFYERTNGAQTLLGIINSKKQHFQIQYQCIFCLWVLTFSSSIAAAITEHPIISTLADALRATNKEKVVRVIIATLRNILEKAPSRKTGAALMISSRLQPTLALHSQKQYADEDMVADIEVVLEEMEKAVQELSSFDQYVAEVKTGVLDWSPVHKSERFWHENALKFNDNSYELLRLLAAIIQKEDNNPVTVAVAVHDIGEYARHVQGGKRAIDTLGIKTSIMILMGHSDSNVRYEALLAVQKLMVSNWEYLGKNVPGKKDDVAGSSKKK